MWRKSQTTSLNLLTQSIKFKLCLLIDILFYKLLHSHPLGLVILCFGLNSLENRSPILNLLGDPLEKQLAQPEILIRRIALMVLALLLVIGASVLAFNILQVSDPYLKNVLALQGEVVQGQAIFEINCAGCHGLLGDGRVGPSLEHISKRRSQISIIEQVISGQTPPMPKFQPSPQEMADLLSYLEQF